VTAETDGEALQRRRRFRPAALPAPQRPAGLFSTLPHDRGCRFKPNTDPAALVYPEWQATPHLNINAVYVHFQTAGFLKAAGAKTPTTSACGVLTGSERIRPVDQEIVAPISEPVGRDERGAG
jgi:hypothetical protein